MLNRCGETACIGLGDVIPDGGQCLQGSGPLIPNLCQYGQNIKLEMTEGVAQRVTLFCLPDTETEFIFAPARDGVPAAVRTLRQAP